MVFGVGASDMNRRWRGWGGLRDGGAKPEYLVVRSEVTLLFAGCKSGSDK
jgi:hypothetical protein